MVLRTGPSHFCIAPFHPFSLTLLCGHSGRRRQNKGKLQGYYFSCTFSDNSQLLPKDLSFYDLAARTKRTFQSTSVRYSHMHLEFYIQDPVVSKEQERIYAPVNSHKR